MLFLLPDSATAALVTGREAEGLHGTTATAMLAVGERVAAYTALWFSMLSAKTG